MYDGTIRDCLPPAPVSASRRISVPAGAWETHAHVVGARGEYPFVPDRHFNPPPASPGDFVAMLDKLGLTYGLVVQVSVHGTDNGALLDALRTYPDRLKGIAVIDGNASDRQLSELADLGVVGIRLLDIVGGGVGLDSLEGLAARCAEMGWHIQLGFRGENYPRLVKRLAALPVPVVIDHMGWCPAAEGVEGDAFQAVLALVRDAGAYVKLSGSFRLSNEGAPYRDTFAFGRALVEAAPDRMLWGSDWPHVGLYDPAVRPDAGQLLDGLADVAPDEAMRKRILVDNPLRIYGKPGA
jgi:predicted TIM-barrel fold metal-dependent hydrolase